MTSPPLVLEVFFFATNADNEPVREWLKSLPVNEKKAIGTDIRTVQIGYPLGMPLVRKLETGLWEVRTKLPDKIARVIFTIEGDKMILLHGFIKKSQKTPTKELETARSRLQQFKGQDDDNRQ